MKTVKTVIFSLVGLVLLVIGGYGVVENYSVLFAKEIKGKVLNVQRVMPNVALLQGQATLSTSNYPFAIAIQVQSGEIFTASTEDRKWAVVEAGSCATARFLPYPPWNLQKRGSYFGAQLIELRACP